MKHALWTLAVAILLFAGCAAPAKMSAGAQPAKDFTETAFGLMFTYTTDGTIARVEGFDKQPEDIKLPYPLEGKLLAVHVSSFGRYVMLLIQGSHFTIVCDPFGNCRKYYLPPPHP